MTSRAPSCPAGELVFIVNPSAAMGAVGRQWPRIEAFCRERLGSFRSLVTSGPGDARAFARREALRGSQVIACVGGDGTLNEVVNGVMEQPADDVAVAFFPFGTGCDFRRTLGIPKDFLRAVEIVAHGRKGTIDLGLLTYLDHENRPSTRYFHNVTSFGLGGEVDERVNRGSKEMGGFISFLKATLISLLLYKKKSIHMKVDGVFDETVVVWNIAVANGQYHGGGMRIAPEAKAQDGLFDVTIVGDLTLPEVCYHFPKLYSGRIGEVKKVRMLKGRKIEAFSDQRVLLDVDGEQPGRLPVKIEMVPGALKFVLPDP